jgi:hypothetical protein
MHRVLSARPVFFFAEGHMVNILPALREAGVRLFYQDWRPPLLALEQPLEAEQLAAGAQLARQEFRRLTEGLRHCHSPAAILRSVLSADQGNVLQPQA